MKVENPQYESPETKAEKETSNKLYGALLGWNPDIPEVDVASVVKSAGLEGSVTDQEAADLLAKYHGVTVVPDAPAA